MSKRKHYYYMITLSVDSKNASRSELLDMIERTLSKKYLNRDKYWHGVHKLKDKSLWTQWDVTNQAIKPNLTTQKLIGEVSELLMTLERSDLGFATLSINTRQV